MRKNYLKKLKYKKTIISNILIIKKNNENNETQKIMKNKIERNNNTNKKNKKNWKFERLIIRLFWVSFIQLNHI